jgi:K+-transporting ATPase KdpF subunit
MRRPSVPLFWLPLLLIAGTVVLAPLFRGGQPSLQSHALAALVCGTAALSAYLFVVILQPEKF